MQRRKFNPIIVDFRVRTKTAGWTLLAMAASRWSQIPPDRKFRVRPDGKRYVLRTHRDTGAQVLAQVKVVRKGDDKRPNPPAAEMPLAA